MGRVLRGELSGAAFAGSIQGFPCSYHPVRRDGAGSGPRYRVNCPSYKAFNNASETIAVVELQAESLLVLPTKSESEQALQSDS